MIGPPFRRPAGLRSTGLPLWPSDGSEYRRELDRRTVYLGSDPLQLIETGAWHAEPVRAAHHRRVGFVFGLVAGIVVTLILTGAARVAASSAARVAIPASAFREIGGDPHGEPDPQRTTEAPQILDPFPVSPPPERAAVEVPAAELVVREKATPRPKVAASGGSVAAARSYALSVLGAAQFACFDTLMVRESNWNPYSYNASSGAYGIPQAVPGSKMAAYGADWRTNPVTQVRWGIAYVAARYGTACAALSHSYAVGWY